MKLKLPLTLALVLAYATAAFAQAEYVLPQVAEGTFGDGSFRMTFVLVNNNDLPAVVTINLTNDSGAPLQVTISGLGTQSQFVVTLEAGATRLLQTAGTGQLRAGAARVTSTRSIGVSAIFSVYDPAGRFLTEAGVGNSPLGTEFVIPVDTTGNFNTGAAFFNAGSAAATLTIRLLDAAGQETQRTSDTLQPGQHKASFVAGAGQIFPAATNFRGTLVVSSSSPITAVVLRQNGAPLSYTSLPAVPRSGGKTQTNLAHVANGTFQGGSFRTTFPIFNISSASANVTVTLARDDGTPFPVTMVGRGAASTFNLVLAPGGSVFLETDGTGGLAAGSAVITSTVPIAASAVFSVFDPQGRFLTEAGVGDAAALTELTLPVDVSASTDTGIAFYNPGNTTITLTIRLLDASGATVATTQLTLVAHGHAAQFATQFFPGQTSFHGSSAAASCKLGLCPGKTGLETSFRGSIAVTAAGGGVSAITLRQNASPLTYTTLPVASGVAPVKPPAAAVLLSKTRTGLTLTADTTLDETLSAGFKISGTINVSGLVWARASDGTFYGAGVSLLPDNPYALAVPAGTYQLIVCQFSGTLAGYLSTPYTDPTPVQVTADTTRNLNVPAPATFGVSGTISGISGPLAGSNLAVAFFRADDPATGVFTLESGDRYQAQLPAGTWNATLTSNAQLSGGRLQYISLYNLGSVTVSGSATTANFTVPALARLSGTVRIPGLASLPPTTIGATDTSISSISPSSLVCAAPSAGSTIDTEPSGAYQLPLAAGRNYQLGAFARIVSSNAMLGNANFPIDQFTRTITGDTTVDFDFPMLPPLVTLSGRVTGPNGQPVGKVQVNVNSTQITGAPNTSYSGVTTADSAGNYRLTVLSGTAYTVIFTPPLPQP